MIWIETLLRRLQAVPADDDARMESRLEPIIAAAAGFHYATRTVVIISSGQ
jgi:hypothetical protein